MSLIKNNTQIQLIKQLSSLDALVSTDLLLVQRGLKSYKKDYASFTGELVDDVTVETNGSNKIQVKNNGVSLPKLATIATDKIIGRTTAGTGNVELVTIEQALTNNTNNLASSAAIKSYVDTDVPVMLGENGYQKFPSGLIMQWGRVAVNYTQTEASATFPIQFPTNCLNVTASVNHTVFIDGTWNVYVKEFDQDTVTFIGEYDVSTGSGFAYWQAIGY